MSRLPRWGESPTLTPAPGTNVLPIRSGFRPHLMLLHLGLLLGSAITLAGGDPDLTGRANRGQAFVLLETAVTAIGSLLVLIGILHRRRTGSLWGLATERFGLFLVAGTELAFALFAVEDSWRHNYSGYLFLVAIAAANIWRSREIAVDLHGAARVLPSGDDS